MRINAVFKWLHGLITIVLIFIIAGFLYLNNTQDRKAGDILESSRQISSDLWLYEASNSGGNATVPVVLRYYLAPKISGTPSEIIKALNDKIPFLEGTGEISDIKTSDSSIRISYSGRIYSIDPSASYIRDGQVSTVHLSYEIQ